MKPSRTQCPKPAQVWDRVKGQPCHEQQLSECPWQVMRPLLDSASTAKDGAGINTKFFFSPKFLFITTNSESIQFLRAKETNPEIGVGSGLN